MSLDPAAIFQDWLRGLSPARLDAVARRHAARAKALGLCITAPDGSESPIPPVLSPVVVEPTWLRELAVRTQQLAELVRRVTANMLAGPERRELLDALFPFERTCIEAAGLPEQLGCTRADLFLGPTGAMALELNATIPAMQGYSDIAARAFYEAVGPELGLDDATIAGAVAANGENTRALLLALQAFMRARTGREFASVALLHRPQDAQLSELNYLARRWGELGIRATVAEAEALGWDGKQATLHGAPVDYVYRHIFARRIEPQSGLGRLLQTPKAFPVSNPVAAPYEMKRTFAELSRAAHEPEVARRHGLSAAEVELVRQFVPWTRPLKAGPTVGPSGETLSDLVAHVIAQPGEFVIKRSWDYGGRAVFLGFESELPVERERAKVAFGEPLRWPELVRRAVDDPRGGGFVVQTRVVTSPEQHLLVTDAGARWQPFFTDFSVYASVGLDSPEWGGVVRASTSAVVNIAGGGGVAPVLRADAAQPLLDAALAQRKGA
jgi:hypothetical protein